MRGGARCFDHHVASTGDWERSGRRDVVGGGSRRVAWRGTLCELVEVSNDCERFLYLTKQSPHSHSGRSSKPQ